MRVALACLLAVAGLGSCETLDVSLKQAADPGSAAPPRTETLSPRETERISLELDDVPLSDVIRMFTRLAGVNIVFDPAILPEDASVTARFTDVPWKPTLDTILEVHGLQLKAVDDEGTVYRVIPSAPPPAVGTAMAATEEKGNGGLVLLVVIVTVLLLVPKLVGLIVGDSLKHPGRIMPVTVFWLTVFLLCVFYSALAGAWLCFRIAGPHLVRDVPAALPITGCALAVAAFWGFLFCRRRLRRTGRVPRSSRRLAAWVLAVAPAIIILWDPLPVWNDHEWKHLPVPERDAEAGDALRRQLVSRGGPAAALPHLWIDPDDLATNLAGTVRNVERRWASCRQVRDTVSQLNAFDGIADLTDSRDMGWDGHTASFVGLRNVAYTYRAYALVKTVKRRPDEGVAALGELHGVALDTLPFSRTLLNKMMWLAIAGLNIDTAHTILEQGRCDPKTLELMKERFPPMPEVCLDMRTPFLGEYLEMRHTVHHTPPERFFDLCHLYGMGGRGEEGFLDWPPPEPGPWESAAARTVAFATFRRNRTHRDLRRFYDLLIEQAEAPWPDGRKATAFSERYARRPQITNLGGWLLVSAGMPSFQRAHEQAARIKVRSDLLAIAIHEKLTGESLFLSDYVNGGAYRQDTKTGGWYSMGHDRDPGTDDDIRFEPSEPLIRD